MNWVEDLKDDNETNKERDILLSVVTYNDGKFEVIIKDDKGMEVSFFGDKPEITDEQFDFLNEVAPACVFTKYTRTI